MVGWNALICHFPMVESVRLVLLETKLCTPLNSEDIDRIYLPFLLLSNQVHLSTSV